MMIWFFVCLFYEWLANKKMKPAIFLRVSAYFLTVYLLSLLSIKFFPISNDEILYDECARQISSFISQSFPPDLSPLTGVCEGRQSNFFMKLAGWLTFIGRDNAFSLIGFNAFAMYLAAHLSLFSFGRRRSENEWLFNYFAFMPPLLYMTLRPAKEATIALLISAVCFGFSKKDKFPRWPAALVALFVLWFLRWQYVFIAGLAVGLWIAWILLSKISNARKLQVLGLIILISAILRSIYGDSVMQYMYDNHFGHSNVFHHTQNSAAIIYKLMIFQGGEGSLHPWNVSVAHIGGFVTPHPFRFIKEALRDGEIKYQIFEEFIYISFWFYLLIPIFFIYFYQVFLKRWRNIQQIPLADVFNFIFIGLLFSLACFSLLYQTPQLYRYKIVLNPYLYAIVTGFLCDAGGSRFWSEMRRYKWFLLSYLIMLIAYTVIYFRYASH